MVIQSKMDIDEMRNINKRYNFSVYLIISVNCD